MNEIQKNSTIEKITNHLKLGMLMEAEELIPSLVQEMSQKEVNPSIYEALLMIWREDEVCSRWFQEIQRWRKLDLRKFYRILCVIANVQVAHWTVFYSRILVRYMENNNTELLENFEKLVYTIPNIFDVPLDVISFLEEEGHSIETFYLKMSFAEWCAHTLGYLRRVNLATAKAMRDYILEKSTKDDIRYSYFIVRVAEMEALNAYCEDEFEKKRSAFVSFADVTVSFLQKYYRENVLVDTPELLPKYGQIAVKVLEGITLEKETPELAAEIISSIKEIDPVWEITVNSYVQYLGFEQERKRIALMNAMEKYRLENLEETEKLIGKHNYEAARQNMETLKKGFPKDLEVMEMALRLRLAMLKEG